MARQPHGCRKAGNTRRGLPGRIGALAIALGALLVGVWFGLPAGARAETTVDMRANRNQVPLGGQLMVEIRVSSDSLRGVEIDLPDFIGFNVVRQSVQRPMQFSFGLGGQRQVKASTNYTFLLQAEQSGEQVIPPVVVRHEGQELRSDKLVIEVGPGDPNAAPQGSPQGAPQPGAAPDAPQAEPAEPAEPVRGDAIDAMDVDPQAFLRTVVDKGRPYEREQVTVTLYLYTRERLQEAPIVEQEPTTDGFWTQDLADSSQLEQLPPEQVGRARYRVYMLRRFAAFPLRTGELEIGPMQLTIRRPTSVFQIFGRGGGPRAPLKRASTPVVVEVQPLPEQGKPAGDVAVGRYKVTAQLDRTQVATGDAVTLTATIRGYGHLQSVRLPDPEIEGVQVLQPQTRDLLETKDDHVGGTRIYEWLLVPKQAGEFDIPSFSIPTFDPHDETYGVAKSLPLTLTAAGLGVAPPQPGPAAGAADSDQGGTEQTPPTDDQGQPLTWGPIRTDSELLRRQQATHTQGFFWPAVLLPWVALLGMLGWSVSRRLRESRADSPGEVALREAKQALSQAEAAARAGDGGAYHAAAANALTRALESRFGEPVGGDTRPQLRKRLADHGMPEEQADRLLSLLSQCDEARFSPVGQAAEDLLSTHAEVRAAFEAVCSWTPRNGGRT